MHLLHTWLKKLVRAGPLTVTYADGRRHSYGDASPSIRPVAMRLTDRATAWRIARDPVLGAGEAYMDGRLVVEDGDIRDLLDLLGHNARWDPDNPMAASIWKPRRIAELLRSWNWRRRARRNVAHHYDLSGRLYDLFLDADHQYSCAYFTDWDNDLDRAQADKKAHIAAKLLLKPGQRVLDIGCGWGGLALYLHQVADVDVLGITLSEEQLQVARKRAAAARVADRVQFELTDYRDVTGSFERIVSVGMFEHVGPPYYRSFFAKCRALLAQDGVMLLHTIGHADGPATSDNWVSKYIFPGGCIPALSQVVPVIEQSALWLTDLEVLRLHYARTLTHWYDRTVAARAEIEALYDARFFRMWQYYLAGAIAGFRHHGLVNFQIQLARQREAVPPIRDYMVDEERRLRADIAAHPERSPERVAAGAG
jgi:cyclopropane-fatty-acyl-phospholipid synthase